jgi:hypothetical protein
MIKAFSAVNKDVATLVDPDDAPINEQDLDCMTAEEALEVEGATQTADKDAPITAQDLKKFRSTLAKASG